MTAHMASHKGSVFTHNLLGKPIRKDSEKRNAFLHNNPVTLVFLNEQCAHHSDQSMKPPSQKKHSIVQLATITALLGLSFGVPISAEAYHAPIVKKMKVKPHKVKVKTIGGKAKIKNKANGKHKLKVKGPTGGLANAIAHQLHCPVGDGYVTH